MSDIVLNVADFRSNGRRTWKYLTSVENKARCTKDVINAVKTFLVEWREDVCTQSREETIKSSSGNSLQESNESDVNVDSEHKNGKDKLSAFDKTVNAACEEENEKNLPSSSIVALPGDICVEAHLPDDKQVSDAQSRDEKVTSSSDNSRQKSLDKFDHSVMEPPVQDAAVARAPVQTGKERNTMRRSAQTKKYEEKHHVRNGIPLRKKTDLDRIGIDKIMSFLVLCSSCFGTVGSATKPPLIFTEGANETLETHVDWSNLFSPHLQVFWIWQTPGSPAKIFYLNGDANIGWPDDVSFKNNTVNPDLLFTNVRPQFAGWYQLHVREIDEMTNQILSENISAKYEVIVRPSSLMITTTCETITPESGTGLPALKPTTEEISNGGRIVIIVVIVVVVLLAVFFSIKKKTSQDEYVIQYV